MTDVIKHINEKYQEICREHARKVIKDGLPLSVRIRHTFGGMEQITTEYDTDTNILSVKTPGGFDIENLVCSPVVSEQDVLIQPIKTGIFVSNYCGFVSNTKRYQRLCRQVSNWEQLRTVGYFGAQKLADGRVYISYSFCQPEDYVYSRYGFDKKVSLTLLHNKMNHQSILDVGDEMCNVVPGFSIPVWMHSLIIPYFDQSTWVDCIYVFNKTIKQQYDHFVDRCISYFKLKEN